MPNETHNAMVICPFYHKVSRQGIVCDGVPALSLRCVTEFISNDIRDEYMNDYCATYDWMECPLAKLLSRIDG